MGLKLAKSESFKEKEIFDFADYREYIRFNLDKKINIESSNKVKSLAQFLNCHPTYVSQVINCKADFSHEQAIAFCRFALFNEFEAEYFVNLLDRDRAGTTETRDYFQRKITKMKNERTNLARRYNNKVKLSLEDKLKYYETWIPQAIHILCQIEGYGNMESISSALNLSLEQTKSTLDLLKNIGLVKLEGNQYHSIVDSIHLEKGSPLHAKFLANWRFKSMEDLNRNPEGKGITYSSVMSLSKEVADQIKNLIVQHLDVTRDLVMPSESEELYVYNIDYYPLIKK